jgi:diguanylate cyclase (GGDEF)-like protein
VRETDTVARLGGDEFVVVLGELDTDADTSIAQTRSIAEKILKQLSTPYQFTLQEADGTQRSIEHRCTASIGVTHLSCDNTKAEDILKNADIAMYRAKNGGRNQICFLDRQPE